MTTNSLTLTTTYTNTDFTRNYKINGINETLQPHVEDLVTAFNASLAGGTAGGISGIMIADDFDSPSGTGYLKGISRAVIISQEEVKLNWGE